MRASAPSGFAFDDATNGYKYAFGWNGHSWSTHHRVPVAQHIEGLDCPTTGFCMLMLGPDYVTLSGSRVSAARRLPNEIDFAGLSCTSETSPDESAADRELGADVGGCRTGQI